MVEIFEYYVLVSVFSLIGFFLGGIATLREVQPVIDRYRDKYGFDIDIEKTIGKPDANRLAKRESLFKKRILKLRARDEKAKQKEIEKK